MSSASSGRYQSRLFSFVHRQSRRLQQQCDRAFQTLQASASWLAAIGLYPLLLFHSTRSAAKPLHQAVKETLLRERGRGGARERGRVGEIPSLTPSPHHPITPSFLTPLDRTVAKVELKLVPVTEVALALCRSSWQLVHQFSNALSTSRSPAIAPDNSEARVNRILTLIWAAIDYFFGNQGGNLTQTVPKSNLSPSQFNQNLVGELLPSNPPVKSIEDPWLSESDLFGDSVASEQIASQQPLQARTMSAKTKKTSFLPPNRGAGYLIKNLVRSWRKFSSQSQSGVRGHKSEVTSQNYAFSPSPYLPISPSPHSVGAPSSPSPLIPTMWGPRVPHLLCSPSLLLSSSSVQVFTQETRVESAPDWIDTHATVMGYVKHPLEQLLAWLDQAMLWLEEVLLKVWRQLRSKLATDPTNNRSDFKVREGIGTARPVKITNSQADGTNF